MIFLEPEALSGIDSGVTPQEKQCVRDTLYDRTVG